MTTDPQTIKARLSEVAADVRDVYQDAVCCIRDLQRQVEVLREERDRLEGFLKKAAVWRIEAEMARVQSDAPDEQQEPERLTVADLENAPVGSVLSSSSGSRFAQKFTKYATGVWDGDLTAQQYTSRELESCGHSVLTYPDPAPVTAETIRQSEPGSTWQDYEGAVFEWTGSALRWQMGEELGDCDYIGTVDYDLSRSTAAPRGDYGKQFRMADWEREILEQEAAEKVKAELPTEPGSVVLVTAVDGQNLDEPAFAVVNGANEWDRLDGQPWNTKKMFLYPAQITGWKPARVVTDE